MSKFVKAISIMSILLFCTVLVGCGNDKNTADKSTKHEKVAPKDDDEGGNEKMIIYFSATNNTEKIAKTINRETHTKLYKLEPSSAYSRADLDWNDKNSRTSKEQNDESARPSIKRALPNLSDTSEIYLGFPLWWGKAPKIINTFIENAHLDGKTVYLFCTSGSSPIEPAKNELAKKYPNIKFESAKRFASNSSNDDIKEWINEIQK